ncbi:MAG: proton-conducting transporter membrane subunit [Thermaurantimonas sp.]|uniref:proton-conducting transporter transmembrane domain-containing protein n=1 Tax=Thermaurantimonas sp. TaxID=2681568 RepID=UPI00391C9B6D
MNSIEVIIPVVWQFIIAIVQMFLWFQPRIQRVVSIVGNSVQIGLAIFLFYAVQHKGILTMSAGKWPAPFGIVFVADTFATVLVIATSISGFAVTLFSLANIVEARMRFGYFPIMHLLFAGLNGAFLTGDIFNLYVWFEIIIISSFVLLTIGGEKPQLEGAVKYFTLNILASTIFLTAIGVLYGLAGTLNMADLAIHVKNLPNKGLVEVTAILFLVGFGIKSAIFPLYFWLPASYHTPPAAIAAIFGGLLTKLGVYALLRVFTLVFFEDPIIDHIMIVLAGITIITGALGAMVQTNIRKIFSYLIISHIGYMVIALGIHSELAITGAVFYMIHDIIVKTNLFMVSGLLYRVQGTHHIDRLGGFFKNFPRLSLLLSIPLFSLVGVPPLSGFWPKIDLFRSAWDEGGTFITFSLAFGTIVTLLVIARVWAEVFWRPAENLPHRPNFRFWHLFNKAEKIQYVLPIALLSLISLAIALRAGDVHIISQKIASELMNPVDYIHIVLPDKLLVRP